MKLNYCNGDEKILVCFTEVACTFCFINNRLELVRLITSILRFYCHLLNHFLSLFQSIGLLKSALSPVKSMPLRCCSSKSDETHFLASNYKFKVKSPYKNPKARRYGYSQELFDGGRCQRKGWNIATITVNSG